MKLIIKKMKKIQFPCIFAFIFFSPIKFTSTVCLYGLLACLTVGGNTNHSHTKLFSVFVMICARARAWAQTHRVLYVWNFSIVLISDSIMISVFMCDVFFCFSKCKSNRACQKENMLSENFLHRQMKTGFSTRWKWRAFLVSHINYFFPFLLFFSASLTSSSSSSW